jgi:uncharacterized phage protein (TIGR01671 family)
MKKKEIKFRAWDKGNNQMIYSLPIGTLCSGELLKRWDDEHLMQYTGLKDSKGKEIYEGDIVRVFGQFEVPCSDKKDFDILPYEHIGTIVFENAGFMFKNHLTDKQLLEIQIAFDDNTMDTDITSTIDLFLGVEILGNIYENPGLLIK